MPHTTPCPRCTRPCQIAPVPGAPGRLLARSRGPQGLCLNCAVRAFIATTPLAQLAEASPAGPRAFLLPHIQAQFARVMAAGSAQMQPEEIDWPTVVAQWDLPLPPRRHRPQSA